MTKLKRYTISLLLTLTTLVLSSCHSYKTLNTDTVFPVESFAYIQVKVKYKAQQCIPPEGEKKCSYDIAELPVLTAAGSGSGAVVRVQKNGTYVLTAAHVCREELDKKVRMPDGSVVIAKGTIQINKLTTKLINQISSNLGHQEIFSNLKHAAYSDSKEVLFVNRGVDISRPLSAQNDCFWWGYQNFSQINKPYFSFKRIVRGYQSNAYNDIENSKTRILCTLFKQPLDDKKILAGIFAKNGDILELFESN